jgi:hypothetical protein
MPKLNCPILVRYGVAMENQYFLGCLAEMYSYQRNETNVKTNKEMREIIIKQQDQISELLPKIGNNFITNNNNNNKFNIQVFLNERCKDAINMSDFIKSIQVSLQQLDYTKQNGIVNGLSNVIIENMNKLGLYQRPIHCTDIKRESLYIKDDDNWEKDVNKEKIRKAIKRDWNELFIIISLSEMYSIEREFVN